VRIAKENPMHAVILAGGQGVRLRPYTTRLPKPLVPVGDEYSILEIVLRQLSDAGFTSATVAIGHLGHLIQSFVGDGSRWGLKVDYTTEESPLGTMGPLLPILDRLPEHFIVMNGDVLTDIDYAELLDGHATSGAPITVATYARTVKIDFGVLSGTDGTIQTFVEKPSIDFRVSMGVYGMSKSTLRNYTPGQALGFDQLIGDLLINGEGPREYAFDGFWLDIGRPEDYDRANDEWPALRSKLLKDDAYTATFPIAC
jgi:NDP-sugar pyrophosphorylase family protein